MLTSGQLTSREVEQLVRLLFSLDSPWPQYGSIQGTQLSPDTPNAALVCRCTKAPKRPCKPSNHLPVDR